MVHFAMYVYGGIYEYVETSQRRLKNKAQGLTILRVKVWGTQSISNLPEWRVLFGHSGYSIDIPEVSYIS